MAIPYNVPHVWRLHKHGVVCHYLYNWYVRQESGRVGISPHTIVGIVTSFGGNYIPCRAVLSKSQHTPVQLHSRLVQSRGVEMIAPMQLQFEILARTHHGTRGGKSNRGAVTGGMPASSEIPNIYASSIYFLNLSTPTITTHATHAQAFRCSSSSNGDYGEETSR